MREEKGTENGEAPVQGSHDEPNVQVLEGAIVMTSEQPLRFEMSITYDPPIPAGPVEVLTSYVQELLNPRPRHYLTDEEWDEVSRGRLLTEESKRVR
jgi:hypothetical protein